MPWPRLSRSASPGESVLPLVELPATDATSSGQPSRARSRDRPEDGSASRRRHIRSSSSISKVGLPNTSLCVGR
jgi:Ca2+-transporting ATPase